MRKRKTLAALLLAALMALLPLFALAEAPEEVADEARQVLDDLAAERYEALHERFTEALKEELPVDELENAWGWVLVQYGDFDEVLSLETWTEGDLNAAQMTVRHAEGNTDVLLSFTMDGLLSSLSIQGAPEYLVPRPLDVPGDATEEGIVLRAGEADETQGSLVIPEGEGPFDAVIMLPDFGAFDRDMTSYGVRPFRDLAMGLAQGGVASLRYEKFTYAHQDSVDETLTVDREYGQDLRDAVKLLEEDARIADIYLLGLGQGAMLIPRYLEEMGDAAAGAVMLAGSPRTLWEIHWTRNSETIKTFPADLYQLGFDMIEEEAAKGERLNEMTDEELQTEMIFGVAASYQKEMAEDNQAEIVLALEKPLLILQAEHDFQMTIELDYEAWIDALGDASFATFKLYPGLNHLFIALEGAPTNAVEDYYGGGHVSEEVASDIAAWIAEQGA